MSRARAAVSRARAWVRAFALPVACALACAACDPQRADWGLDAIEHMQTPPDDASRACGVELPPDTQLRAREACAFSAGTRVSSSLGMEPALIAKLPIQHVIVMMKENRSYDHLFGKLREQGQPDSEAVPAEFSNPDVRGAPVFPRHADTTCIAFDPGHQSESMLRAIDAGKMDGFVRNAAATTPSDGSFVMSYYDASDFPFYYWLANTFAISDHHFAPMASGTFGNRAFMMFATNAGVVDTGITFPPPNTPSILELLMNQGFTWGAFSDDPPLSGSLGWSDDAPGVHHIADFYAALAQGTLPNVAFVDSREDIEDDHPTADIQRGEAWVKAIYDRAIASPEWQRLAILWTYDEGGGFADHVPPPAGCQPLPSLSPYTERGPRVSLVAISPWAKRNYVSHAVHDHTAITRFIEALFDLPALTARDANSDALLDLFDFSCGRDLSVPAAPDPGVNGCTR